MTQDWRSEAFRLRYALGDRALFSLVLPLKVRTYSLVDVLNGVAADGIPDETGLSAGEVGFLERSLPIEEQSQGLPPRRGLLQYVTSQYRRYYIDLSLSKDDYLKKFSSKSRSTLLRKVKRFARESGGEIDWREYRTPQEIAEFFPLARQVSQLTYQERLLDAGLPEDEDFRASMLSLAEAGSVRAYLLFLDGKTVAYLLCPIREGTAIYAYLGYDPDVARLSPGTVLQWLALDEMFADAQLSHFDFTEGEGEFFQRPVQRCPATA